MVSHTATVATARQGDPQGPPLAGRAGRGVAALSSAVR
jgi:hypothetical protein